MNIFKKPFLFILFFMSTESFLYSQDLSSDFSNLNLLELNSSELDLLLRRASSQGLTQMDLLKMARSQGLSEADLIKVKGKIDTSESIKRVSANASTPIENSRLREEWNQEIKLVRDKKSDVYGFNVFQGNGFLTFQNDFNSPTPSDYVLGPGDNIYVDIYGESESYFKAEISPEGEVIFENIGPINLNGLKLSIAKKRLINKFSSIYFGLNTSKTFLNVSVGSPRSIKVNIVGEVNLPGTYNFSALNTVYNALYVAGGITENATLREIKVFRNNRLISQIDVYDYLKNGNGSSNIRLENNDLILVSPYTNRVSIDGAVKLPGKFEFKADETLSDLLFYSGGFKENALKKSIKVTRIFDDNLKVVDVNADQFDFFQLKTGDRFSVDEIIEKYNNRIIIKGAIYRPGVYSLSKNMTIKDLIGKSEGLKPDVFLKRVNIKRTNSDYSTTSISLNLKEELDKPQFNLQEEDIVTVFSINDLSEESYVEISGEVSNSGIYPYSKNVSLIDLILNAGGFKDNATGKRVEITRRVSEANSNNEILSKVITVNLSKDLDDLIEIDNFKLSPFDQVVVRKNPNFYIQQYANVEGEVMYPGRYAISSKSDKISDLLERSGGLKKFAYKKGATLIRLTEFAEPNSDVQKKINDLTNLKNKVSNKEVLSESDVSLIERLDTDLKNLDLEKNNNQNLSSYAKKERISEIVKRNATSNDIPISKSEAIGIDLESIVKSPGSKSDLLIQEGDIIIIPKKLETVRLRGELLYPTTVRFLNGRSLKYYINSSGGFDNKAKRSGTYVVYANGDVARTKKFLFFNLYPKIEPGSEVIVPKKSPKNPIATSQILNFTTGLATLILAINQIK